MDYRRYSYRIYISNDIFKMRFAEVVDSIESLKEFMKLNNITPSEIIIVWDEDL